MSNVQGQKPISSGSNKPESPPHQNSSGSAATTIEASSARETATQSQTVAVTQSRAIATEENVGQPSGASNSRRCPSSSFSLMAFTSHASTGDENSRQQEGNVDEAVPREVWAIDQFLEETGGSVPVWARPIHANEEATIAYYKAKAKLIVDDIDRVFCSQPHE